MQCIILAGGLATRMKTLTQTTPKFLIPIDKEPFAHHQITLLASQGIKEIVLCIGHLGDQIQQYVGNGSRWGVHVRYVNEGHELKGTGGALRLALDEGALASEFFTLYGDSYLPISYPDVVSHFHAQGMPALMAVMRNENQWDKSNCCYANGRVTLYDKRPEAAKSEMHYIDYGLSIFKKSVIELFIRPGDKVDLAEVFSKLSREGTLAGYLVRDRFYEIGSVEGLESFRRYLKA